METIRRHLPTVLALFISVVFIQSLFYKFIAAPETLLIFGTLDQWAASKGFAGLFLPPGIFNYYVVGSVELLASVLLLIGSFVASKRGLQPLGALLALAVISGAIFFHLFTPLGVVVGDEMVAGVDASQVESDGGTLFIMACGVWVSALLILILQRAHLPLVGR